MDTFNVESVSQLVTAVHQASHVKLVFKILITQIARRGQIGGLINPNVKIS